MIGTPAEGAPPVLHRRGSGGRDTDRTARGAGRQAAYWERGACLGVEAPAAGSALSGGGSPVRFSRSHRADPPV